MNKLTTYKLFERYYYDNFEFAVKVNDIITVKRYIKKGYDVNYDNVTKFGGYKTSLLILACGKGCFDVVKLLVEAGANINYQDNEGITPLIYAINNGYVDICEYLLEKGADISLTADDGRNNIITLANFTAIDWLATYDVQKMILSKCPTFYKSFINRGIKILPAIDQEYPHLKTGEHLGLL